MPSAFHADTPLAQRMRPTALDDIIGQEHLLAADAPLRRLVEQNHLSSIILHGEAGIGKTTIAMLLAKAVGRPFHALSALNTGVKQLREVLDNNDSLSFESPVVFIDEIHRFNKAQQDALLGAVEAGDITLIGATTENPSFSVNNALLSRCQVYRLEPLDNEQSLLYHKCKSAYNRQTLQSDSNVPNHDAWRSGECKKTANQDFFKIFLGFFHFFSLATSKISYLLAKLIMLDPEN